MSKDRIVRKRREAKVLRQDPQREAPRSTHLAQVRRAISRLPFSITCFFTDENNNSVKVGQFVKIQEEY